MSLKITSQRDGFRRAGRAWSVTPTEVDASDFTAEQLAALKSEPMLKVEAIVSEPGEPAQRARKPKSAD